MSGALSFDADVFSAYFNRRPFFAATNLPGHPAFTIDRLVELAKALPEAYVEYNAGELPVGAPAQSPRNGLSPEETLRRIRDCSSWMVLKRVEQVPAYARLLDEALDEVAKFARPLVGELSDRQAFVFVSSPGAVTPLHMDPEHNFLLQLQGTKTVRIWDADDRAVVKEEDLETFHGAFRHRNLPYEERFAVGARTFELSPGQALHFPVTVPHWVKNGPEVSISFSVTFRSDWSKRRERLHRVNRQLRRLGLTPSPVGANVLADAVKATAAGPLLRAREAVAKAWDLFG